MICDILVNISDSGTAIIAYSLLRDARDSHLGAVLVRSRRWAVRVVQLVVSSETVSCGNLTRNVEDNTQSSGDRCASLVCGLCTYLPTKCHHVAYEHGF